MKYWCSRKHDWEGILTTANHNKKMTTDTGPTVETEEQMNGNDQIDDSAAAE
jgi:hypothetical protein